MSATNPYFQKAVRFCELCGQFMGNLTRRDWDRDGHICKDCEEPRSAPMWIMMDGLRPMWRTYNLQS